MDKEKEVENTITDFPRDFWNYAVNPISGFIVHKSSTRLKAPKTIENDKRQRRRALRNSSDK